MSTRKAKAAPKGPAPFETWWRVDYSSRTIEPVRVRACGETAVQLYVQPGVERYFPTFAEAQAHLVGRLGREVGELEFKLDEARSRLAKATALTPPEDARDA